MKNVKILVIGFVALYLQIFFADFLDFSQCLSNFLLPFVVLVYAVWGSSRKTIWLIFFLGFGNDIFNSLYLGFSPFVLLICLMICSKLFSYFNVRNFSSCLLVLFVTTVFYQFVYYFIFVLLSADVTQIGSLQMISYLLCSLVSNTVIFIIFDLVYNLRFVLHEKSR